ncbi:Rossmann-fold NAD(P)-binding domain-containing protein [Daejeonella lutea]|uniref:Uncharacterized conserved protein YbjT, contains NAD(P)-binding and DUF2867 domains n=1 Tax=Daejeonella lutea TaxID=572036 RepID=A0A1T5BRR3_9SPHI|nr:hypothetical protein [Daejeonella lutea]SKB50082.1 Uncharacterized conserved protein YbjT, contains NAD(P)-binding and DUF2867 domains [Daejeonella lutea]
MIVIIGATGNVGSKVTANLQHLDIPFLGIRSANGAPDGIRSGDLMDPDFLKDIASNAQSIFSILPGSLYPNWEDYAELLTNAIKESPVSHIVNISNAVIEKNGEPSILNSFETKLNTLADVHIKHLRCANFFDNLKWGLNNGYEGDLKLPYISTHEIAGVASDYLSKRNFVGHSVDVLLGPADYSMNEFCQLTGADSREMLMTEESRSFFEPFNQGAFKIAARTTANTTSNADPRYYLDYFLTNELRKG